MRFEILLDFLWPLEGLILFYFPKTRIGDIVAGTEVRESKEIDSKMKWENIQAIQSQVHLV